MVAADEGQIFTCGGQIVTGVTPYVRTTTEYLAALIAITRALRWATTYLGVHGRAICIRYDCTYAAMIASGAWKPKKHKEAAEDARRAWRAAWHSTNGRLWLQRRKQNEHALHIHVADVLASKGARGVETYAATVS